MAIDLRPILLHLPAWLLVLFRLTGIFVLAPVLGGRVVPGRIKVMLALGLSFCVYPMLLFPAMPSSAHLQAVIDLPFSLWSLLGVVAMELILGLVIGYCASLPLIGVQLGGRVMDQQMGLGLAGVFNPEFDENTGIVSEFYFVLATAMFVILGGHLILFDILVGSFQHFPLGGFRIDTMVVGLLTALLTMIYEMAVRVAAPMLCLIFLETLAMGFIARTVPQMNILSVGFAIRILLGAVLLVMAIGIHGDVLLEVMQSVFAQLRKIFGEGRAIGQ